MWEGGYEKKDSFLARIDPSTDCPCQSCRSLQFTSVSSIFGLGPDCFVYSELAPVESNFWRALVQSCVRPYCLCRFSTLCGSGIVLSSSFYSLRLRRQFVIVGRKLIPANTVRVRIWGPNCMAINYKFNDVPQASVQLRASVWVLTNPQRYRTPSVPWYNFLCNEYTASFFNSDC